MSTAHIFEGNIISENIGCNESINYLKTYMFFEGIKFTFPSFIDFTELTFDFGDDERTFDTDGEYEIL